MPVNTTQTTYFSTIGPGGNSLSFSTIASTLGQDSSRNIRFGSYLRKTDANEVFADVNASASVKSKATGIVPDSIENRTSGVDGNGISVSTNHKVSSLKNMIKRYDVSITGGSNSQTNISGSGVIGANWASNLDLNVPKRVTFNSDTWKGSTTSEHAVVFNDAALNLDLTFNGTQVYGKEGTGGQPQTVNQSVGNGTSGGGALYLRNTTTRSSSTASDINLNLSNTALIAGGGGGGGGAAKGTATGATQCVYNKIFYDATYWNSWASGGFSCSDNGTLVSSFNYNFQALNTVSINQNTGCYFFRGTGGYARGTCYYAQWDVGCQLTSTINNGTITPASGGGGGTGQGSNNIGGVVSGSSPGSVASLNCGTLTANYYVGAAVYGDPTGGGNNGNDQYYRFANGTVQSSNQTVSYSATAASNQPNTSSTTAGLSGGSGGSFGLPGGNTSIASGGSGGPWLTVGSANTRWKNLGASGDTNQKVNIAS